MYGVIEGNVQHGILNQPIAGANAFAVSKLTGRVVSSGFSGTTQVSYNPATGGLSVLNPAFNILDGKYRIPVPLGIYGVGIEPVDGQPAAAGNISLTAQIGSILGQLNFNEEFYNRHREEAVEVRPGESFPVVVLPGWTRNGIDLITTQAFNINNFGNRNFVGFTGATPGQYYAVQVPASQIAAIMPGELLAAHSVLFNTRVLDASTTPKFAEAMLTTGVVNADGTATIDLAHPLERDSTFVGQDDDFSPFFLKRPRLTGTGSGRGSIPARFRTCSSCSGCRRPPRSPASARCRRSSASTGIRAGQRRSDSRTLVHLRGRSRLHPRHQFQLHVLARAVVRA